MPNKRLNYHRRYFNNVDVFNGTKNKLYEDHFVLVEGDTDVTMGYDINASLVVSYH